MTIKQMCPICRVQPIEQSQGDWIHSLDRQPVAFCGIEKVGYELTITRLAKPESEKDGEL